MYKFSQLSGNKIKLQKKEKKEGTLRLKKTYTITFKIASDGFKHLLYKFLQYSFASNFQPLVDKSKLVMCRWAS